MKNILIIGGSGTWSGKTYIPSIKYSKNNVMLVAILDFVDPYCSKHIEPHSDYLKSNNVKWIKATNGLEDELIKKIISDNDIDIIIISTPHEFHYKYTLLSLKYGVDVICDKPIIATPAQSSSKKKAIENIYKHNHLLETIKKSNHRKLQRRCYVLTPLRRRVQEVYTNIYDSVNLIKEKYGQDISDITITHNDGVFRFYNEIELNGAHGYSDEFGKLTHTGYHILDVIAALIEAGANFKNVQCICKIVNCNTIKDTLDSPGYDINANLLNNKTKKVKISSVALKAEMDITISYILYYNNVKFCNIIVNLLHSGKSNRTQISYDSQHYNDEGRTNELNLHIQQGSLFSVQMITDTKSGSNGTIGDTYTFKNYHPKIAKEINKKEKQILDAKEQSEDTIQIVCDFYDFICKNNLKGYYAYTDFLMQRITDELYISALIAKTTNKEYKWNLGRI